MPEWHATCAIWIDCNVPCHWSELLGSTLPPRRTRSSASSYAVGAPMQWTCTYSGSAYAVGLHLHSGVPWTITYRQPGMHTSCQPCTYVPCLVQPACCTAAKSATTCMAQRDGLQGQARIAETRKSVFNCNCWVYNYIDCWACIECANLGHACTPSDRLVCYDYTWSEVQLMECLQFQLATQNTVLGFEHCDVTHILWIVMNSLYQNVAPIRLHAKKLASHSSCNCTIAMKKQCIQDMLALIMAALVHFGAWNNMVPSLVW